MKLKEISATWKRLEKRAEEIGQKNKEVWSKTRIRDKVLIIIGVLYSIGFIVTIFDLDTTTIKSKEDMEGTYVYQDEGILVLMELNKDQKMNYFVKFKEDLETQEPIGLSGEYSISDDLTRIYFNVEGLKLRGGVFNIDNNGILRIKTYKYDIRATYSGLNFTSDGPIFERGRKGISNPKFKWKKKAKDS